MPGLLGAPIKFIECDIPSTPFFTSIYSFVVWKRDLFEKNDVALIMYQISSAPQPTSIHPSFGS